MRTLRRAYHRGLGEHARFNFAVALTIVFVAWVVVPGVAGFVGAWAGYAPLYYEPKDLERPTWIDNATSDTLLARLQWNDVLGGALFLLMALVWLTVMADRTARHRRSR